MDTYEYTCEYCGKKYIPGRRYVQRFCKPSCKASWHNRKKKLAKQSPEKGKIALEKEKEKKKITLTGIAEAGIGSLTADGLKALFTRPEDKVVTQGDLNAAKQQIVQQIRTESLLTRLSQPPKKDDDDMGMGWV